MNVAFVIFFLVPCESLGSNKYPTVGQVEGKVFLITEENKKIDLKKSMSLKARAHIESLPGSRIKFFLSPLQTLTLFGETEVTITSTEPLESKVFEVFLKKGQLRWQNFSDGKKSEAQSTLKSKVFESILPPGDFYFTLNEDKGTANLKAFKGDILFSILNGEDSKRVSQGSEATFEGVVESGEFVFDEMLKGKKIPRGRLLPVELISQDEVREHQKLLKKEGFQILKFKQPENKAKKVLSKKRKSSMICNSPSAKYNDCVWTCVGNPQDKAKKCLTSLEGVSCVRQRCDGSGRWIESMKVDTRKSKVECSDKPIVAPCDY
jgi:hypothetical protein